MLGKTWRPALALGAVLAAGGAAGADDRDARLLFAPANSGTTMTLGGQGSAARAATEDNELTHGYRYRGGWGYGWGGYRGGWGGGWGGWNSGYWGGYRGGYWGGYRPFYSNYYSFNYYRPAYFNSFYYRPYPVYSTYYYSGCGPSIYLGIGGGAASGAPVVPLGTDFARPAPAAPAQPMIPPAAPGDGTFPYDGGPANPVPAPQPDARPIPPSNPSVATDLPISLKPKAPAPYKYKAYGEK